MEGQWLFGWKWRALDLHPNILNENEQSASFFLFRYEDKNKKYFGWKKIIYTNNQKVENFVSYWDIFVKKMSLISK